VVQQGPADVESTSGRGRLIRVQTPQAFRARPLLGAYRAAADDGFEGTDTSSCIEKYTDEQVRTFPGDEANLKVTYAHDVAVAGHLLSRR
jgi:2-C-methyl-D-erythritol 4-phosphate cytidylyltransferase